MARACVSRLPFGVNFIDTFLNTIASSVTYDQVFGFHLSAAKYAGERMVPSGSKKQTELQCVPNTDLG